jgi:hypothetical protein
VRSVREVKVIAHCQRAGDCSRNHRRRDVIDNDINSADASQRGLIPCAEPPIRLISTVSDVVDRGPHRLLRSIGRAREHIQWRISSLSSAAESTTYAIPNTISRPIAGPFSGWKNPSAAQPPPTSVAAPVGRILQEGSQADRRWWRSPAAMGMTHCMPSGRSGDAITQYGLSGGWLRHPAPAC